MANVSDWSANEKDNLFLDELNLSDQHGRRAAKVMAAVKAKADEVDSKLDAVAGGLVFRGVKATYADLEAVEEPAVGDMYSVTGLGGENYAWNGEEWDALGTSDANVVHKTGDEEVYGLKILYGTRGSNLPEFNANDNNSFYSRFVTRRDTVGESCSYLSRYRSNVAQGASSECHFFIGCQENKYWISGLLLRDVYTVGDGSIDHLFEFIADVNLSDRVDGKTVTHTKNLGRAAFAWSNLYCDSGPWSSSDARLKANINALPDALCEAWNKVGFKVFQFNDAIDKKGSGARFHVGLIAQDIQDVFATEGIDAGRYGFFGYDKWEEKFEDGTLIQKAGDKYSVRYEEALCLEAACQRVRAERAEARIAALEKRMAALEDRINGK